MIVPKETKVVQGGRQPLPDQLRGLALLGIVFVNMPYLAMTHAGLTPALVHSGLDGVLAWLIVALAQGKFYLLFSFLFGYSLTLLLQSQARPGDGLRRYRRRLLALGVLGLLHATLLFVGDILLSYAVLGLALPWFAVRRTRTALRGAAGAYLVGAGLLTVVALGSLAAGAGSAGPGSGGFVEDVAVLDRAVQAGGVLQAAHARLSALPGVLLTLGVLNWSLALSMFLLGLAAGRLGVLRRPERYGTLWRRLLLLGATVGLPGGAASAWLTLSSDGAQQVLGVALGFITAPALTGAYVALAALNPGARVLRLAAPAGRMSLTGYLGESLLLGLLFAGWGLGWYGQLSLSVTVLVTLGVWLALELFAHLWLRHFRVGPFEWLLRAWTNGRWGPLRRQPRVPAKVPR
ncbi:DUF418 domain-containing protein, partial [Deinococcus multiflagellatus]|uniref:DUF418 domain-containing protein n=1 Tax=Deinococcus multiflagellatus TaxID=1656887 RepID=A0ABW1ZER7_9DEIO